MSTFDLTQKVKVTNPTSNIDWYYGGDNGYWASIAEAKNKVLVGIRQKGKTVLVNVNPSVDPETGEPMPIHLKEYWWRDGITDNDLVEKFGGIDTIFTPAQLRENIVSGESLSTILGKISKWYTDFNGVAFSGSYNDLNDTPNLGSAAEKDYTNTISENNNDLITSGAVWNVISNLPEPMVFKGGLSTTPPVDGSANVGDTYKATEEITYGGVTYKVGDTFICNTKTSSSNTWVVIPSGDEESYSLVTHTADGLMSKEDKIKIDEITTQTPYTAKGTSVKVPQITTNSYGQVTTITEIDIDASDGTLGQPVTATEKVGGIEENEQLSADTTFYEFAYKLLNPYKNPVVTLTINPRGTREVGNAVSSVVMTVNVTKKTSPISKIEFYVDNVIKRRIYAEQPTEGMVAGIDVIDSTIANANGDDFVYTYTEQILSDVPATHTFKVIVTDSENKSTESDKLSILFNYCVYAEQKTTNTMVYRNTTADIKAIGRNAYYNTSISTKALMNVENITIKYGVYIYVPKGYVPLIHTSNNTTPDLYDITATAGYVDYALGDGTIIKYTVWEMRSAAENFDTYNAITFTGSYSE